MPLPNVLISVTIFTRYAELKARIDAGDTEKNEIYVSCHELKYGAPGGI